MRRLVAALCLAGQTAGAECLALGDLGYVLPVQGEVMVTATEALREVTLDLAPGGRAPKLIRLHSLAGLVLTPTETDYSETLPNGLVAHFGTRVGEAVGSGGADVLLSGWLEGDIPLGVSCSTQQEIASPEWCLPILGQLRLEAEGCETKGD